MKFSDMTYTRPDLEAAKAAISAHTDALKGAESYEEARAAFLKLQELHSHLYTADTLAYVRHTIDTRDAYYDEEARFLAEHLPLLREAQQEFQKALLSSPFRPDFEAEYGGLFLRNMELELKTFIPAIVPLMQRENALTLDYGKLIASAQIPFEGGVYTLSQLTPFKQDPDDARRRAAWEAEGRFYLEHGEELDALYDELVQVRTRQAREMGYDNYVELGYYRMGRNSYTKEDVEKFRAAVVKYLVPAAEQVVKAQARRLGKEYPLNFADAALFYRTGNAAPQGGPDDIVAQGVGFYHDLSPETAEFIDFMMDGELLDVLSRTGKAGGGYCTEIPDYRSPFIFANFNGTQGDVEVMTHEAGHAFAAYMARDMVPLENHSPTYESCEIHSMSMEFFAWPWSEKFFGPQADKFRYKHLSDAVTFIPYGTMVDHFQHVVYENPDMTPAQRHAVWKELLGVYMPWMKLEEIPFYGDAKGWQRQSHIYECPFYYIDYCLAQTVALEFWNLMQTDRAGAWQRYLGLVKLAGTRTFTELVASAGLDPPFGDDALRTVSAAALRWLEQADPASLA